MSLNSISFEQALDWSRDLIKGKNKVDDSYSFTTEVTIGISILSFVALFIYLIYSSYNSSQEKV